MNKKLFIIPIISLVLLIILFILVGNDLTLKLDKSIMNFIYDIRGNKGGVCYYLNRILTEFGYFFVVVPICIVLLVVYRCDYRALTIIGCVIIGALLNVVLKQILNRPRPDVLYRWMEETSSSFPSGHTAASSSFYLAMIVVLRKVIENKKLRISIITISSILLVIIPITRVVLGVHYPSDVLGGFLVGFTVVFSIYPIFLYIHKKMSTE